MSGPDGTGYLPIIRLSNDLVLAKKYISRDEALLRMQRYCAYQDRCHQEVRNKVLSLGIYGDDLEAILAELIAEDFLNEERFARSFARGKFRLKGWGRQRIMRELQQRQISDYCLRKALEEIDETEYRASLQDLLRRKAAATTGDDLFQQRGKVAAYATGRGFEAELVWELLREILPGE